MTEPNEKKYSQLALFSVIVAEVVVTPTAFGSLVYWLMKDKPFQIILTALASLIGFIIAFYRIYLIQKNQSKE